MAKTPAAGYFTEEIQDQIMKYVPGWIETIGDIGSPPDPAGGKTSKPVVAPNIRAQAAKIGLELYSKMVGPGGAPKGRALLDALTQAGKLEDDDSNNGTGTSPVGEGPTDVGAAEGSGAGESEL